MRTRLAQLVVLAAGLAILVPSMQITGAAIAASIMTIAGIVIYLKESRQYVDCTVSRLMGGPMVAAIAAGVVSICVPVLVPQVSGTILLLIFKGGLFTVVYGLVLLILEKNDMLKMLRQARKHGGSVFSLK